MHVRGAVSGRRFMNTDGKTAVASIVTKAAPRNANCPAWTRWKSVIRPSPAQLFDKRLACVLDYSRTGASHHCYPLAGHTYLYIHMGDTKILFENFTPRIVKGLKIALTESSDTPSSRMASPTGVLCSGVK